MTDKFPEETGDGFRERDCASTGGGTTLHLIQVREDDGDEGKRKCEFAPSELNLG